MIIGDRLRELREQKKLSQGHIEERTGPLPCYISRVEHGHTVPAVQKLEKSARALEVPMYQLFVNGEDPAKSSNHPRLKPQASSLKPPETSWGNSGKEAQLLVKFRHLFSRMHESELGLLLAMAQKMARKKAI